MGYGKRQPFTHGNKELDQKVGYTFSLNAFVIYKGFGNISSHEKHEGIVVKMIWHCSDILYPQKSYTEPIYSSV